MINNKEKFHQTLTAKVFFYHLFNRWIVYSQLYGKGFDP